VSTKSNPIASIEAAGPELKHVAAILTRLGEPAEAEQLLALHASLSEPAVRVVVIGAFNQGKSTLINALIGAKVLPVALVPTTAVLTRVISARPPGATLYYVKPETSREVSLEEVSQYLTLDPVNRSGPALRLVEVRCPWRKTEEGGLELYDTPGFNDLPEQAEAARQAIQKADLLLFILNARQPLTEQEEIIWQSWAAHTGAQPLFLLNFLNLLEEEDREAALERVRTGLRERLELNAMPELIEINALLALRSRLKNDAEALASSGLPELLARLDYYSGPGRATLLNATRLGRLQSRLGEIYSQNRTQLAEAEEKLGGWRERQTRQKAARQQAERATTLFNEVETWKGQSLSEFEYKLLAELERAIEQWPLSQVRPQVEGLVSQRIKDWLAHFERESNKLLAAIPAAGTVKALKLPPLAAPAFNYTYNPPSTPPSNQMPDPFEAPLDFLGSAVRGLGQFANDLSGSTLFESERGLNFQAEQRERVIAHSRLAPLVRETVARLDKQIRLSLTAIRPGYIPKNIPLEPVPAGLETEVKLRQQLEESIYKLSVNS